jgi:hypothetical protein
MKNKKHEYVAKEHPKPWVVKKNSCDQWIEDANGGFVVLSSGYTFLSKQPGSKLQNKTFSEICRLFNKNT